MKKRIMAILLTLVAAVSFTACTREGEDYGDRTLLYVGAYEGGWGTERLDAVRADFEADNPDINVLVDGDKKYGFSDLLASIDIGQQDLFIAPVYLYEFISQDKLMDVTDVVTTPLNEQLAGVTETATIHSKMWDDLDEFYSGYRGEGKYYAVPFGGGIYSINYDMDLFDTAYLYIGEGTSAPNITWVNEAGPRSVGQDGQPGTYDDGLPVTYDDFLALLARMKANRITPFIWSSTEGYTSNFLYSLFASYEGKDNFDILKNMDGEYTFEGDSEPTEITPEKAYLLQGMTGKKKALEFAYDIIRGGYYHSDSGNLSMDFLAAQDTFLMSAELAKTGSQNRIAFLIDGAHWYHEAGNTLREMADMSAEYANRRFGIMPFPRFEGSPTTRSTYFASSFYNAIFIRKNASQPEAAKRFFAYLSTEEALRKCTEISGMVRPLEYTMPQETLASMPIYYQSLWNAFTVNSDIVYHTVNNPYIYEHESFFEGEWKWQCQSTNGQLYSNPFVAFARYPSMTVDDYMNALKNTFNESYWRTQILER